MVFPRSLDAFTNAPQHPVGCAGSLMLHKVLVPSYRAVPSRRMLRTVLAWGPRPCPQHMHSARTPSAQAAWWGEGHQAASGLRQWAASFPPAHLSEAQRVTPLCGCSWR